MLTIDIGKRARGAARLGGMAALALALASGISIGAASAEDQLVIDLIGQDDHPGAGQDLGYRGRLGGRIDEPARIGGGVEHERAGPVGNRVGDLVRGQFVVVPRAPLHDDGDPVAERDLLMSHALIKRLINHAPPKSATEGYAADWTTEQLREPAQRIADRIEALMQ